MLDFFATLFLLVYLAFWPVLYTLVFWAVYKSVVTLLRAD
jgi:hypothetical protein